MHSSSFDVRDLSGPKIALVVWFVLVTLYFFYGQYNTLTNKVYQTAYNKGGTDAITQLIQKSNGCKAVPITVGEKTLSFVNVSCLQQAQNKEQ